ncbi:methylmalonyl Co-A mutase-associated GTPase MeaB [Amycolatopsis acidiphila]|uniref:Methylmalonyl Co-A mutase-associated GTPase MeaB n=1 Tax=Amycolatopsis acidiphila TaxID=715473 RepID=A0A557ZXZ7_9PSEU|nr:methylmalonyl Co-A mutase-associated GTPase MeaB [Amycolatopsis acidiphila]TVT16871.1 methylmalonyl Co-A mutase-associated GTPase MeaB [Amycolatopsis acidiphila]UIJ58718.1 methylmalonyl Co-A mutase-associated GTPase MeaB [Amycolatopsis acidiphila]GHG75851.1 LAO/AO transport system kinase [Amycolatopsis acidiphila]
MPPLKVAELVDRAREGQPRAVAKLISLVEDAHPRLREVAAALTPHTGHARVIGLTGPPGVGKSTSTSMLLSALRKEGKRVGVLAIDPSSPFSGGALLGDRIRMTEHATDPGVFIRSMATRGHLGGLAWATPQAVRVLDAAGFDVVLIETVGVGQSEVDVVKLADTTVVLLAPGMGDGIQAAKAGVLEIADVFVVNKADRDGAETVVRDLKQMISMARREVRGESWRQPIVSTVASRGEGADELVRALAEHHDWLGGHGELVRRRVHRAASEVEAIALRRLRAELADTRGGGHLNELAEKVVDRTLDPYAAADALLDQLRSGQ